jgi:glycosyltransferase involved in cell wall biosynthesis
MSFFEEVNGYSLGGYQYLNHRRKTGPIRLCMAIQVKDEADIIELNIRYHAKKGCEAFFVVDNGSTDGTREILQSLKSEYYITIIDDSTPDHNQSANMSMLSHLARKKGFDWVIENDADEFWYPNSGSLLSGLNRHDAVLRVKRVNALPLKSEPDNWINSPWHTLNTLNFDMEANYEQGENNFLLAPVLHKVMVNPFGLIGVSGGNHGARHVADKVRGRKFTKWNDNLKIFHFALRSYERFERKVENINSSLKYTSSNSYKKHNFGRHAIYWNEAYEKGELHKVYEEMLLDEAHIECMKKLALIEFDDSFLKDNSQLTSAFGQSSN